MSHHFHIRQEAPWSLVQESLISLLMCGVDTQTHTEAHTCFHSEVTCGASQWRHFVGGDGLMSTEDRK